MKKNRNFKIIMEASINGELNKVTMPTPNLNKRRMSLEEVKEIVSEEFEKANKEFDDAKGGYGKFMCGICKMQSPNPTKDFDSQKALNQHLETKHTEDSWSHAGKAKPLDWMKALSISEWVLNKSPK